jgi:hypothetical protein
MSVGGHVLQGPLNPVICQRTLTTRGCMNSWVTAFKRISSKSRSVEKYTTQQQLIMAPTTRSTIRPSTPTKPQKPKEYDTVEKGRFFNAYDHRKPNVSLRTIADEYAPSFSTAQRWLDKRTKLGSPALRRTRKLAERLGRLPGISPETCKMLVSPSRNPIRDQ